jgi:hypothetical protein
MLPRLAVIDVVDAHFTSCLLHSEASPKKIPKRESNTKRTAIV